MNYIKTMRIIGFKKFKDTKINFNEHINIIIVGENEVGKSKILEVIDIVINQLYKSSDKSIIIDLINKENLENFKKKPSIENLPKIYIELELDLPNNFIKNIDYSGLEYLDSDQNIKTGIFFTCEIDKEKFKFDIDTIDENPDGKIVFLEKKDEIDAILNDDSIVKLVYNNSKIYKFNAIGWGISKEEIHLLIHV